MQNNSKPKIAASRQPGTLRQRSRLTAGRQGGFTLIETIVAIAILSAAVAGPLTLAIKSIGGASVSQDQLTAFYLAQEAIEYVRKVRDDNILQSKSKTGWLDGLGSCMNEVKKEGGGDYNYTGDVQRYKVPAGISQITVTASGASGSAGYGWPDNGGKGGRIKARIAVTPGETLYVYVGGQSGYNGGTSGGASMPGGNGGTGGGASDIKRDSNGNGIYELDERIVVAGGGGGGSAYSGGAYCAVGGSGGGGGGLVAQDGGDSATGTTREGGGGGTQSQGGNGGGSGGRNGYGGDKGLGGVGGNGGDSTTDGGGGGGGGGGYYGGGGGEGGYHISGIECGRDGQHPTGSWKSYVNQGGGGGGGSSYASGTILENDIGVNSGNGKVSIYPPSEAITTVIETNGCYIDTTNNTANQCPQSGCPVLNKTGNGYGYDGSNGTIYTRTVKIDGSLNGGNEAKVNAEVKWPSKYGLKTLNLQDNIFNWR